jgi:trehalose 6-phosphate phosphatase
MIVPVPSCPPAPAVDAWCLFLDVDGTLLEIAAAPDQVVVEDSLRALLLDVRRALDGAVALVSGRTLASLDQLFEPDRWPAAGLHGIERRDVGGRVQRCGPDGARLDGARRRLAALAARSPGVLLEDKGRSLALHFRQAPQFEQAVRRAVEHAAADLGPDYRVLRGRQVFELKPAIATKADAVRAFLAEPPFAGRRPIYVGDDVTDLDGFAAVERAGGLSVAVGDQVQAQMRVASPRDVRALLADVAERRVPAP